MFFLRHIFFFILVVSLVACTKDDKTAQNDLRALEDSDYFPIVSASEVELGRLLFFDKVLSGNKNISCATCHHPSLGTSDGLPLGVGEGGRGLGPLRDLGEGFASIKERVPRNSPALFNLGAKAFKVLFYDGRVREDSTQFHGFATPAKNQLPTGLRSPLAAQAMFPVTSPTEMAGQFGENEVAQYAEAKNFQGLWATLAQRLRDIPLYVELFKETYSHINTAEDINFEDAANAIAAFETSTFKANQSPFDKYYRGDHNAFTEEQMAGKELFYGKAKCATCHSGPLQTDHDFHVVGFPQLGPGKKQGFQEHEDFGLEFVTKKEKDRYRFKTPSLRNVELTAPYGHSGAFQTLKEVVSYHLDAATWQSLYAPSSDMLPSRFDLNTTDWIVWNQMSVRQGIMSRMDIEPVSLSSQEIDLLVEFLKSLTDPNSKNMLHIIPESVPSGLPVSDSLEE